MPVLSDVRAVELTTEPGGALAGRLLAAYGADVISVEPPEGHAIRQLPPWKGDGPDASVLFAYLGSGKRSVAGNLRDASFRASVRRLIADADVVIESYRPGELAEVGLGPAQLIEDCPRLVVCSISPFGQDGPQSPWRATSLIAAAAGGQMGMCGDFDQPPLKTAGHQGHYQAGLHSFSAILSALFAARRDGLGDWLDISIQEVQASTLEGSGPWALMQGAETGRLAGNTPFAQWGIHPCQDGYIGVASMPRQSYAVYDCIEHPELKEEPGFESGWNPEANEVLAVLIPEWTAQHTAAEIFEIAARHRAPFSMIPGPRQLLEWPGLRDIGFWREVEHPVLGRHPLPAGPLIIGDGDRGRSLRAPLLGEHNDELLVEPAGQTPGRSEDSSPGDVRQPFAGIRVIDMTAVWAGPHGTRFLADQGAEVIKVEGPSFADPVRTMLGARNVPEVNESAYFNEYNRNKLGISLDIKQPEGMEALRRLIATADIFIENWSGGVAERSGLGYEDLKQIKPDIIHISMPGFGHHGGDADRIGFGPTIEQMGGLVALQGYEGGPPHRSGISYGDPVGGTIAAGGAALALLNRQRTGAGCKIIVPQRDAICGLVGEFVLAEAVGVPLPQRIGNRDPLFAPHNVYSAAPTEPRPMYALPGQPPAMEFTDSWLAVAVDSDPAWEGLKRVIGALELEDAAFATAEGRRAGQDRIDAAIEAWAAGLDAHEAAAALQAEGVPAAPVLTPLLATKDAHLEARGFFLPYSHPDAGEGRTARPAWRMARRPADEVRPAPGFGADSREVLSRIAGYSDEEIEALRAKAVTTDDLIASAAG